MHVEKANPTDAIQLTNLTIRSKSNWDYSPEQIEAWREDLTISEEYIEKNEVYNLYDNNMLVGYYSYCQVSDKKAKLDNLFIEPANIGTGCGKLLMNHFIQQVKNMGIEKVVLHSDPNAEQFYLKFGFKVIGQLATSIEDRFLPIMELEINKDQPK